MEIIPLISQEDYLHFFRYRFEDIIVTAINDGFEVIILDLSLGFYGLSKNMCEMMLEQIIKREEGNTENTRLEALFNSSNSSGGKTIGSHVIFVTTSDKPDYRAIIPLFCDYIQRTHEKKNEFQYRKLYGAIDFVFNKIKSTEGEVLDPPRIMGKILEDLKENFKNRGNNNDLLDVIGLIKERVKKLGAVSCENIPSFEMGEILSTIKNLYSQYRGDKEMRAIEGITGWCINISKTFDITELKEI